MIPAFFIPAPLEGLKAAWFVKSFMNSTCINKLSNVMGPSGTSACEGNSRRVSSLGSAV